MKEFTRRDGKKREGYRQSERARYHIFRQQPNKEEEETGDGMMTLAVFFLCLSVVLILIQSVFYDTNRDFSFYQMSGVCWYLLRTAAMLLVALIPFLVSYEQWAFFAAISLDVLSIVVVLLGGNGGFPATGGQWILVIGLFFSAVLLMVRHREFSRSLHYRFSSGTILGAVIFLLLQWSNTAYALHTIYMQSGEVVSVGTCYGKALCLWLPRGQFINIGKPSAPMLEGYFCQVIGAFFVTVVLTVVVLTIYAWLVCKPGESRILETIGYGISLLFRKFWNLLSVGEEKQDEPEPTSEEPLLSETSTLELEEIAMDRQKLEEILQLQEEETSSEVVSMPEEEVPETAETAAALENMVLEPEPEAGEEATEQSEEPVEEAEPEPEEEVTEQPEEPVEEAEPEPEEEATEQPEEPVEEAEPEPEPEEEVTEQPEEPVEEAEPEPEEEVTEQPEEPVEEVEPKPEAEEETTEQPEEPVEEAEPEPEYVEEPRIPVVSREISACVADYGLNFASYMALDRGGKVFTGEYVEGYIPYRIIGKEAIISGGPICRMEDMEALLREYEDMCYEKKISMTFVNVSREQAEQMEEMGFDLIHCGAEPRFALKQYKLKNPAAVRDQREKIRKKYGVSIYEYRYYEKRDEQLEMQMLELNDDWLDSRNGENFTMYKRRQRDAFLPQTMDFSSGDGRRYYYALDEQQKMAAFIVFCPVTSQNGYSCEAGRKRPGMVKNLMELIMHEAFAALKAEGANWASMGLIPDCAGQETCNTRQKRWLEFIYRYYESIYGCRDYREALPKYKPTSWEDMYIVTREYQTIKSQRNQ